MSQNSHSASCEVGRLAVDLDEYQSWKDPNDALAIMGSPVLRSVPFLVSTDCFVQRLRMLFLWRLSMFDDLVIPNSTRYPFLYYSSAGEGVAPGWAPWVSLLLWSLTLVVAGWERRWFGFNLAGRELRMLGYASRGRSENGLGRPFRAEGGLLSPCLGDEECHQNPPLFSAFFFHDAFCAGV